jgi:hypothetical protein
MESLDANKNISLALNVIEPVHPDRLSINDLMKKGAIHMPWKEHTSEKMVLSYLIYI